MLYPVTLSLTLPSTKPGKGAPSWLKSNYRNQFSENMFQEKINLKVRDFLILPY